AAYRDGDTFPIGPVGGITDVKNRIPVAKALSKEKFNSFRVGAAATKYSMLQGFETKNMLTERANQWWEKRLKEIQE
ncbi:isoaspartyl peptidase/L-asparaginase, partial [Enterococcus faecalis]|uniref:isoaspartyl peptidase/L-asparaginase n=1 Tax=Enterococcus faecalis TaxID=1351 RepID=UPI003D6C1C88